jgi:hypothetical protein
MLVKQPLQFGHSSFPHNAPLLNNFFILHSGIKQPLFHTLFQIIVIVAEINMYNSTKNCNNASETPVVLTLELIFGK